MRRPTIFLMLAMVAAVLAAIVVFSALKNREAQVQVALAQTEDIVVAARDVQLGEKLTATMSNWSMVAPERSGRRIHRSLDGRQQLRPR